MGAEGGRRDDSVEQYGWGKKDAGSVENQLFAEGYQFDFFQAVRLLEMIQAAELSRSSDRDAGGASFAAARRAGVSPGEGADPRKEIVRFMSAVNLDFPASDIAEVNSGESPRGPTGGFDPFKKRKEPAEMVNHFKQRKGPAEMTVNFLGLAGSHGALDIPTTELVMQRSARNDPALRDFLDIFNHRLVSILYRIRKHHRVGIGVDTPGDDQISHYLYSVIGMGTPNLKGRMHVRDRALLYYSGILAQQPRSMVGLETILSDYFQVPVKGHQFTGKWCDLEEDQRTRIGYAGQNQRLGRNTVVLGTRVWDQHGRFDIHLGPLSLKEFKKFLPTTWQFGTLCDLVRFYVKDQFDFNVRLILKAEEIPTTELKSSGTTLAWTTWLGKDRSRALVRSGHEASPAGYEGDPYITISPESLQSETVTIKSRIFSRLPRGKQAEALRMMSKIAVPQHEVVMRQDERGTCMYVIRSGCVNLYRRTDNGKDTLLRVLGAGDSFGERALLAGKPYSETAVAQTPCELYVAGREQLMELFVRYPQLEQKIVGYLSQREDASKRSGRKNGKSRR